MAVITPMRTPAETAIQTRFNDVAATLPGAAGERRAAMERFREKGLPHKRIEAWHYSDLRGIMRNVPALAPVPDDKAVQRARVLLKQAGAPLGRRVVLLDGYLSDDLSDLSGLPAGLSISSLAAALMSGDKRAEKLGKPVDVSDNAAVWLNTAFMTDGVIIDVAANAMPEQAVEIIHIASGKSASAVHGRVLVLAGAGASLTVIERQLSSAAAHHLNTMVEFGVGTDATVEHVRIDRTSREAVMLSTLTAAVNAKASFSSFNLQIGGGFVRHQPFIRYAGEEVFTAVRGVNLLGGKQHADTTLTVDHAVPHGVSRELFRSVVDGEATGTFQGKIIVRQDAQKTDGQMASNAILLSDEATMNNKPELEIFADDVVCAHGATCGSLNDDQLFYLQARGLARAEAEALLIEAFAGEAIDEVKHEGAGDMLRAAVAEWLAHRSADPVI